MGEPLSFDQSQSEGEGVVSDDGPKTEKRKHIQAPNDPFPQLERETCGSGGDPTQVWLPQTQQGLSPPETSGREKCTSPKNEILGSFLVFFTSRINLSEC